MKHVMVFVGILMVWATASADVTPPSSLRHKLVGDEMVYSWRMTGDFDSFVVSLRGPSGFNGGVSNQDIGKNPFFKLSNVTSLPPGRYVLSVYSKKADQKSVTKSEVFKKKTPALAVDVFTPTNSPTPAATATPASSNTQTTSNSNPIFICGYGGYYQGADDVNGQTSSRDSGLNIPINLPKSDALTKCREYAVAFACHQAPATLNSNTGIQTWQPQAYYRLRLEQDPPQNSTVASINLDCDRRSPNTTNATASGPASCNVGTMYKHPEPGVLPKSFSSPVSHVVTGTPDEAKQACKQLAIAYTCQQAPPEQTVGDVTYKWTNGALYTLGLPLVATTGHSVQADCLNRH